MSLVKKGRYWYWAYRNVDGRITSVSLKTEDRATAEHYARNVVLAVENQRRAKSLLRFFPEMKPVEPLTVTAPSSTEHQRGGIAIKAMWECASQKRVLSARHQKNWELFAAWCPVKYADLVTPRLALQFLEARYGSGNGKTYNNMKSALNTVFRCCLVEAGLSASPFAAIVNKRVTEVNSHRNLTAEEFDQVMKVLPMDLKVLAMLSRWTCQRLETCARITPGMFNFERRVFVIQPSKTARFHKFVVVPIMPELEAFIRPLLGKCKPDRPIVENFATAQADCHYWSKRFTIHLKRCGIDDTDAGKASFHSIRGTAITWFKEHGVKGEELRSITGHATDAVEDIYARDIASLEAIALRFRRSEDGVSQIDSHPQK